MVSGYYGRPSFHRAEYEPEGAMTAFVSGETVATNSYLGGKYNPYQHDSEELEVPIEENVRKGVQHVIPEKPIQPQFPEGLGEEEAAAAEAATLKPKPVPRRKPLKPQPEEEEDDEDHDEGAWPFHLGRRGPSYNALFPIMFGGYQGRSRNSEGGYPGSATAIANSFSTGKGGVASSHATAYGDPYVSTLLRNGFNFKKKPSAQKEDY